MTDAKPLTADEIAALNTECSIHKSDSWTWCRMAALIATIEQQQEKIERLRSAVNSIKHIAGRDGPASELEACRLIESLATEALAATEQT